MPDLPAFGHDLDFNVLAQSGKARRGRFSTAHGVVDTPAFMPVGTVAVVRGVDPERLAATGAQVVLSNTYHLSHPERLALVERHGGLHGLMRWNGSMLTDSGGFQVFSLPNRTIGEEGVRFTEPDGTAVLLTPERSMEIQRTLGADMVMAFDECIDHRAERKYVEASTARTLRWLRRCMQVKLQDHQRLLGIIQGGMDLELRAQAVKDLAALDLPAYAIGGVSVGEGHESMVRIVRHTAPLMPTNKIRYLMGVGLPEDLVESVAAGMDIHDCVIPTRYGREGTAFTWNGKLRLQDKKFRKDRYPLDTACGCFACKGGYSRAYIRHLLFLEDSLGEMLLSLHNIHFYQDLMRAMRSAIEENRFEAWRSEFHAKRKEQ